MKFIQGTDRTQVNLFPVSIEQSISQDNEVRLIDLFVDGLNLEQLGFNMSFVNNGRPAYHPADLLKLFIYGYLNRIRSSRQLEKECHRNIELIWLLKNLQPDHNTISNFRKNNAKAIKQVFRNTVSIAKHFNLIGASLIAGDSTKLRAQNSKKNNYNESKIERHLKYIEEKLEEYTKALSEADNDNQEKIKAQINQQEKRKTNYQNLKQQLTQSGQEQISTSDSQSRQMIIRNNITEVAYNVQTTTDAKHCLPIDYKVTNNNDSKAMGNMLRRAKSILRTNEFTALYDKGYHTGSELKTAQELQIKAIVAIPDVASNAPDTRFNVANFRYIAPDDVFICPENQTLRSNGNSYHKNRGKHRQTIQVKQYKTNACKGCPSKTFCTRNKDGRLIERSEYAQYIEKNKELVQENTTTYKRRQAIVEHPFGTIKRQWGYNYIMTKQGMERASADVGLIFTAYNLRRILNIVGIDLFRKYLKTLAIIILSFFTQIRLQKLKNTVLNFFGKFFTLHEKIVPKMDYI